MRSPYEVLGIREGAGVEEIKSAYKDLVRKYHPDQYRNNPLSDLAEEKLKEINQAYEMLLKKHAEGSRSNGNNHQNTYNSNYTNHTGSRAYYDQARAFVNSGRLAEAEAVLNRMTTREAEWYFIKGLIYSKKGWYNEAYSNITTAVNMEPSNYEYREALNRMNYSNQQYQASTYNRRGYDSGPDLCGICQCLICSDCCCECMGGDLIRCC